jgi:hypothetical protein
LLIQTIVKKSICRHDVGHMQIGLDIAKEEEEEEEEEDLLHAMSK